MMASFAAYAQNTIKVVVTDEKDVPVIGATVMIQSNRTLAAVSDINGEASITFPAEIENPVLEVSCIGFKTSVVPISESFIKIVLKEDAHLLDEVVVVGYGSMRRSDLTGSVASVRIDEMEAGQSGTLDQLIQGHAAGVQVVANSAAPDAGINVIIRGRTSLSGDSQPIYVVDGVILSSSGGGGGLDSEDLQESTNALLGINPQDIASIEILKDASATAIYGSEGANGVVLITTKTANREKPRIKFSAGVDYMVKAKRYPTLSFDEYVNYLEANTFNTSSKSQLKRMYKGYVSPQERGELQVSPVDWQDYSLENVVRQRYFLSIAGRPNTLSYNFSVGYNDSPGVLKTTGIKQYTFRLNVEKTFLNKIKLGTKINYSLSKSRAMRGASTGGSISTSMTRSILVSRPYRENDDDQDWEEATEGTKSNPALWLNDSYVLRDNYRFTPNLYFQWDIVPWLTLRLSGGGDYNQQDRTNWLGASVNHSSTAANATCTGIEDLRWNADAMLMFNKSWGRHNLSGTVGTTMTSRYNQTQSVFGYNINQYYLQSSAINSATNATISYAESRQSILSFLARAIYNYMDRYVLTGTFRVDGSSKFKGSNKYGFFPSFAFAWRMNQESWFNVKWISQAKFRIGWGEVGNSGIAPYQTYIVYDRSRYPSHDPDNPAGYVTGLTDSNLANENLKWETTKQWNGGLDIGFFHGRLSMTVDAYYKMTYDLLNSKKLPYSSGYTSVYVNQGQILNKGIELSLEAIPVKTRDFEWTLNGNISFNRNRIINIGTDSEGDGIYLTPDKYINCNWYPGAKIGEGRYFNTYANIFVEGQPMGLFYGLQTDGIVQVGETAPGFKSGVTRGEGYIRYKDLDHDGVITDKDKTVIGDPNPDFTFGFGTSISYKRLTLSMSFNGSFGNDICYTGLNNLMDTGYTTLLNVDRRIVEGAWTPGKTDAKYPELGKYETNYDSSQFSDLNLEDGSYIRLANINLFYNIPIRQSFLTAIDVGVSAGNLFVWTKYSGWDPEVSSFGANTKAMGIDACAYPSARSFRFDVKFTF